MKFIPHYNLEGRHAFLSASKYHWIGYEDEKFDEVFRTALMAQRGTELHELAHRLIKLGVKLPKSQKTLNMYVNDAIGFRMVPEQILWYSDNAFGTADCISYRGNQLRIHDLKTGRGRTSEKQLEIYAAFFCLEYDIKPHEIEIELRIYQNDYIQQYYPEADTIVKIMNKIIAFDKRITALREEAEL